MSWVRAPPPALETAQSTWLVLPAKGPPLSHKPPNSVNLVKESVGEGLHRQNCKQPKRLPIRASSFTSCHRISLPTPLPPTRLTFPHPYSSPYPFLWEQTSSVLSLPVLCNSRLFLPLGKGINFPYKHLEKHPYA